MTHNTHKTHNIITPYSYDIKRGDRGTRSLTPNHSKTVPSNQSQGRSNRQHDNRSPTNPLNSTANQNATRNSASKTGSLLLTNQKPCKYQRPN